MGGGRLGAAIAGNRNRDAAEVFGGRVRVRGTPPKGGWGGCWGG